MGRWGGIAAGGGSGGAAERSDAPPVARGQRDRGGGDCRHRQLASSTLSYRIACHVVERGTVARQMARLRAVIPRALDPASGSQHACLSRRGDNQGGTLAEPKTVTDPPTPWAHAVVDTQFADA